MRGVALAFAVTVVFSMFLPCISVKMASPTISGEVKKDTYSVSPTDVYEFSSADISYYKKMVKSHTESGVIEEVKGYVRSTNDGDGVLKIFYLAAFWDKDASSVLSIIGNSQILLMALAAIIIGAINNSIFEQKKMKRQKLVMFILVCTSLVYLISNIVMALVCRNNVTYAMSPYINFTVGASSIISLICVIGIVAAFYIRNPQEKKIEYDDPDVSYAPYVV